MTIDRSLEILQFEDELYFRANGDKTSPFFFEEIQRASFLVSHFCRKYAVKLECVDVTNEQGYFQPAYLFSDNLGYYTFDGILNSLVE